MFRHLSQHVDEVNAFLCGYLKISGLTEVRRRTWPRIIPATQGSPRLSCCHISRINCAILLRLPVKTVSTQLWDCRVFSENTTRSARWKLSPISLWCKNTHHINSSSKYFPCCYFSIFGAEKNREVSTHWLHDSTSLTTKPQAGP